METLPPLSALLAFDAVYRTGSVTAAAERLGRTHGAVSKQLRQLHEHAGAEILRKKGSGLELTAEGRAFAKIVAKAFEDLRGGYATLKSADDSAAVTIGVSATFARAWLIPTLARFNRDWPEIDVLIRLAGPTGSRELDPKPDLLMSWDRLLSPLGADPSIVSLGDVHIGPVMAPGYRHALSPGSLVCDTRIDRRGAETVWKTWSDLSGIAFQSRRVTAYDHSYLAFEAARMGVGAVMAARFLIEPELKDGSLVAPAGFLTFKDGFYVRPAFEKQGKVSRSARILLDWLKNNARSSG